jgi:hypothetical protein
MAPLRRRLYLAVGYCESSIRLTKLMVRHNAGVQVRETFELKQIDFDAVQSMTHACSPSRCRF